MANNEGKKTVLVTNEKGGTLMSMNSIKRKGDRIAVNGILMGAWPSDMFVGPEDVSRFIGKLFKSPSVIWYVITLPFIRRHWRKAQRKKEQALQAKKQQAV
jgi:hypothetical protein